MRALKIKQTDVNGTMNLSMRPVKQTKKMQLLGDKLTPSEANEILSTLIDKQINFYKLQYLSLWERNHSTNTDKLDAKAMELANKKEELKKIIKQAKEEGYNLSVNSTVEIKIER